MRWIERASLLLGGVCLALFVHARVIPALDAGQQVATLERTALAIAEPDTSLWSSERIDAYEAAVTAERRPIGVIRLPAVDIEAPIYRGADDAVLDRGVGLIPGTARLTELGNSGLAAHRDGFFRGLKDVTPGDLVIVTALDASRATYRVTRTEIVDPSAVEVLAPTSYDKLTLVTCHPFYFVGSAPNRFIVHARRVTL